MINMLALNLIRTGILCFLILGLACGLAAEANLTLKEDVDTRSSGKNTNYDGSYMRIWAEINTTNTYYGWWKFASPAYDPIAATLCMKIRGQEAPGVVIWGNSSNLTWRSALVTWNVQPNFTEIGNSKAIGDSKTIWCDDFTAAVDNCYHRGWENCTLMGFSYEGTPYGGISVNESGLADPAWLNYTYDIALPIITIQKPDNTTYNTQTIWFNATLDEAGSWCGYSMNGTANVTMANISGNWNAQITNCPEAAGHNVSFCCNDTLGNMNCSFNTASTIRIFSVDLTFPKITITKPSNNTNVIYGSNGWNRLNLSFNETVNWAAYSVNGSANITTGAVSEFNTTYAWGAGNWNITVYANDSVDNMNKTYINFSVIQNQSNPLTAWLNDTSANGTSTYGSYINASSKADWGTLAGTLNIYRNESLIHSGTSFIENITLWSGGVHEFKFNLTGTVNYTSNSTGLTWRAAISAANSTPKVEFNGSASSATYYKDQVINITGSCGNAQQTATLTGNHTVFGDSFDSEIDGAVENITDIGLLWYPSYDNNNISVNCTVNENYTFSSNSSSLNISADFTLRAGENITLSFRPANQNSSLVQPLGQNLTNGAVCINVTRATMAAKGLNISLYTSVNTSLTHKIEVWADVDSTYAGAALLTNVTASYYWIYQNLTFNNKTCFWLWANFNNSDAGVWVPKLKADSKRYS